MQAFNCLICAASVSGNPSFVILPCHSRQVAYHPFTVRVTGRLACHSSKRLCYRGQRVEVPRVASVSYMAKAASDQAFNLRVHPSSPAHPGYSSGMGLCRGLRIKAQEYINTATEHQQQVRG